MMYVAKVQNGKVKLYDASTGSHQRNVGDSDAVSANVQGETLSITYKNGKVKIYDAKTGSHQRTI